MSDTSNLDREAVVFANYLAGLHEVGWSGDERLARLGYTIPLALYWGGTLPCEAAISLSGKSQLNVQAKYGRPADAVKPGWTALAEFALDRADEARYWIGQLG